MLLKETFKKYWTRANSGFSIWSAASRKCSTALVSSEAGGIWYLYHRIASLPLTRPTLKDITADHHRDVPVIRRLSCSGGHLSRCFILYDILPLISLESVLRSLPWHKPSMGDVFIKEAQLQNKYEMHKSMEMLTQKQADINVASFRCQQYSEPNVLCHVQPLKCKLVRKRF